MKRFFLLLVLALPVFVVPLQGGCNGQSEGQRCDPLNVDADKVNLDCRDGLACTAPKGESVGFCCSPNSAHPACVSTLTTSSSGTGTTTTTSTTGTGGGGGAGGNGTGGNGTGGVGPDGGMDDAGDGGMNDAGDGG